MDSTTKRKSAGRKRDFGGRLYQGRNEIMNEMKMNTMNNNDDLDINFLDDNGLIDLNDDDDEVELSCDLNISPFDLNEFPELKDPNFGSSTPIDTSLNDDDDNGLLGGDQLLPDTLNEEDYGFTEPLKKKQKLSGMIYILLCILQHIWFKV